MIHNNHRAGATTITNTYIYPSGFEAGERVRKDGTGAEGVVTFPGGGNGTHPEWVAVSYGTVNGRYIGTHKVPASTLVRV